MATRDTGTEQLIKDTAKRIFFTEGRLHATTQDIADAAQINRTLVHYYFRSRDVLIKHVFDEGMLETRKRLDNIFENVTDFREKIKALIEVFMDEAMKYPYRELFLVTELNSTIHHTPKDGYENMIIFLNQIRDEMDKGNLKKMDPRQFVMNLFALMAYPFIAGTLNKDIFKVDDETYRSLMNERKELIFNLIYQ